MKQYILLAILLSIGTTSIVVTSSNVCACTSLANQNDCGNMPGCTWAGASCKLNACSNQPNQKDCLEASQYCQWNTTTATCSSFTGCDTITATSGLECMQGNLLCLAYNFNIGQCEQKNSISNTCSQYNDVYCDKNFGSDGLCYWDKTNLSCNPINQCSQINSQKYCQYANQKNGITCQWNADNNVCQQITNCSFFTSEDSCRYYISNLQSVQLNLCYWNATNNTCVAATNTRALLQNTCLKNTGYTYRWLSGVSDPAVGFCAPCSQLPLPQITLVSRSQCQCTQYVNENDCMTNNSCTWTNNTCSESACNAILTINSCITQPNCFWNYNKANPGCETQTNGCASISYKINGVSCAAQSLYCAGFTGASCTAITTMGTCQSQATLTNCESYVGSNGFCRWINNACVPLTSCAQITDAVYCGSWQNYCVWNGKQQSCNSLTCSSYTTQATCTYVITGFQPSAQQLCRWNVQGGSCQNANSALLLTAANCVASSGNFYRWTSTNTTTGFCATCQAPSLVIQTNTSCSCQQFTNLDSCSLAGYCSYESGTCQTTTCSQVTNALTCASLKTCYWSTSKLKSGCQPFTSCASLSANNQLECVQQSGQCRGYLNGNCQTSATETCANIYSLSLNKSCVNFIGTDGVCFLQKTGATTTCIGFNQCAQATSENICLQNKQACTWVTTGTTSTCQALTCASFVNQQACTFYFPSLLSTQPVPCTWNSKTNTCNAASEVLTQLTQQTCQANTFNSFRWITLSTNSGYCVRCQQQIQSYNQCACSQLTSQNDCSATYDCYWNGGTCKQLACNQIYLQSVCASQYNCSWTNNTCQAWGGNCQSLFGQSQTQCISQNISCVGFANGVCNQTYNNCEYFVTPETCSDQKGLNGVCYWNNLTKQCLAGVTCQDLPETACRLRQKSCYWNTTTCSPLTCEDEYTQFNTCTFVVELLSANRVQSCKLSGTNCYNLYDAESLNQETCFANSNRTSRWIPLSKTQTVTGVCTQCAKTLVPIQNLEICQCRQYMTQEDCLASPLSCAWSSTSSGSNSCVQLSCGRILSQSQCAQTFGCAYVAGTGCQTFGSCANVTVTDSANPILTCLSYSIKCRGYNGTNCTQNPTLACAGFTPAAASTAANLCDDNIGTDGPCYYQQSTNTCIALTTCNQIVSTKICGFYANLCQVEYIGGGGTTCTQVTCASFKSVGSCTYYITSFQTGAIQQCQWVNGACQNLISSTVLTQDNCATNTAFTYRWATSTQVGGYTVGYCTKCSINQLYSSGQCACNQLLTQNECEQNLLCLWSTNNPGSCYNKPCNQILYQSTCSTNPRCAWSQSNNVCQTFSGCADLSGINQYECASYSVYCAGLISSTASRLSNGKYICQSTSSSGCSTKTTTTTGTTGTTTPECENRIISSGICMMGTTKGSTTPTCTQINSCSQIGSQQRCETYIHSCYWTAATEKTAASCGPATCANLSRQYCTYVLSSLNAPSSSTVTQCYWQAANNACVQVQNVLNTLTQQNCYTNSFMMSRWSPSGNTGYCVSCTQYPITLSISSPCSCSTLSQYECAYASPKCVYTNNKCVEQTCSSITSQTSCSAVSNCIWGNNGTATACMSFNSNCNTIQTPSSPLTCLQSSINCPVFTQGTGTTNSTCTKKQTCSSYANATACSTYNSMLAVSQCTWVESSNKCLEITNCGLISDVALCGLQTNRCQWSVVLNSCITQTCSSFTSPDTCNFIFTSYAPGDVTLCSWNSYTNDCRSAPLESVISGYNNTNSTQCYSTTGHTYHQDGTSCVACYQSILAVLSIVVLLIVL